MANHLRQSTLFLAVIALLTFALRRKPGPYHCQVTVLDPTGQKAAFWQAPIVLIP